MSYRCFTRPTWTANPSWPDGYEPLAVPMDGCRTLARFDNRQNAIDWCSEKNEGWRRYWGRKNLTPTQKRVYYSSSRYEFTEE